MIILHPIRWFEPAMVIYRKAFSLYKRIHLKIYWSLVISTIQVWFESSIVDQDLGAEFEEYQGLPYWALSSGPVPMGHSWLLEMPSVVQWMKTKKRLLFFFFFVIHEARLNNLDFINSFIKYVLSIWLSFSNLKNKLYSKCKFLSSSKSCCCPRSYREAISRTVLEFQIL